MGNTSKQDQLAQPVTGPEYAVAERVIREQQSGRVQSIAYDADVKSFRYMVKWDLGPTTSHLETELTHVPLPTHYP